MYLAPRTYRHTISLYIAVALFEKELWPEARVSARVVMDYFGDTVNK